MKSLIIAVALLGLACASSETYNFNSVKYCGLGRYTEDDSLNSDDRATLIVRKPSGSYLVQDRCSMSFSTTAFSSKPRIQVRFDSIKNQIGDKDVSITFYDYSSVKSSKRIMTVSQANPIRSNTTFVTKSSFLTVEVNRDVDKDTNYDVEIILVPVSSASAARWSFVTATVAMLVGYII